MPTQKKKGASKQEAAEEEEEKEEEEDEAITRSKSYTQQVPKCWRKSKKNKQILKKGKEKAIKLHEQEASKEEAEAEEEEEDDEAITRSISYTQQMSKCRRKRKHV